MTEDKERQAEAKAILDRLERERTGLLDSALTRAAAHLRAADAPADDRIETWGRRIGRLLSLIALLAATLWFLAEYLANK